MQDRKWSRVCSKMRLALAEQEANLQEDRWFSAESRLSWRQCAQGSALRCERCLLRCTGSNPCVFAMMGSTCNVDSQWLVENVKDLTKLHGAGRVQWRWWNDAGMAGAGTVCRPDYQMKILPSDNLHPIIGRLPHPSVSTSKPTHSRDRATSRLSFDP